MRSFQNLSAHVQDGWFDDRPRSFLVYAPSRTAVIYALVEDEPKQVKSEHKQAVETKTSVIDEILVES